MFCVDALDVAAELGVPAYFFFASAAGDLACFLNLPYLYPTLPSFKDMKNSITVPVSSVQTQAITAKRVRAHCCT
ncbi:unnamed protein product, partial [Urochloa humidicola]